MIRALDETRNAFSRAIEVTAKRLNEAAKGYALPEQEAMSVQGQKQKSALELEASALRLNAWISRCEMRRSLFSLGNSLFCSPGNFAANRLRF